MDKQTRTLLIDAQLKLADAVHAACIAGVQSDMAKHSARLNLYKEKEAGRKITEEAIRSEAFVLCGEKLLAAQKASAELEIARAYFKTALAIAQGTGLCTCESDPEPSTDTEI